MSMQSITTWSCSQKELFALARRYSDLEGTALFFSGRQSEKDHISYLTLFPEKKITVQAEPGCWDKLQKALGEFDKERSPLPKWIGYIGYEMGCFADKDKHLSYKNADTPDCSFYAPSTVISYNHLLEEATLYTKSPHSIDFERPFPDFEEEEITLDAISDTFEGYKEKIAQIKELILEGEIYQVNLSQEFVFKGKKDPFTLFEEITKLNPTPFSTFIQCGAFAIVSSSPERFFSKKEGLLETRPIKGTAPRSLIVQEDLEAQKTLLDSPKEQAELLMITDLMRSDLGKISLPASVKTLKLAHCEVYRDVYHLVSVIQGKALPDLHPVSQIRELFPGGSITGCPKLRAMEVIAHLENRPRGIYTGSIGYFSEKGDFDFNIAIRTLVVHPNSLRLQLGGGIVIDSDPKAEYEETFHKGRTIFSVLGQEL